MQTTVKERPILFSGEMVKALLDGCKCQTRRIVTAKQMARFEQETTEYGKANYYRRFGRIGDRLWVKETYTLLDNDYKLSSTGKIVSYRADHIDPEGDAYPLVWKPSIFMPRWASRITLEITDLRIQRLQDISEEDARAEGVKLLADEFNLTYKKKFNILWETINGAGSWDANPFVWVIGFKRV